MNQSNTASVWCVVRTDDLGVSHVMAQGLSPEEAHRLVRIMTKRGHKQTYEATEHPIHLGHLPHKIVLDLVDVDESRKAYAWGRQRFGEPYDLSTSRWMAYWDWDGNITCYFRDPEDAIMFELTWR